MNPVIMRNRHCALIVRACRYREPQRLSSSEAPAAVPTGQCFGYNYAGSKATDCGFKCKRPSRVNAIIRCVIHVRNHCNVAATSTNIMLYGC